MKGEARMVLRSLPGRGAVVGCAVLAISAFLPAAACAAPSNSSAAPAVSAESVTNAVASVITTTPSAWIGGLPASSLNGEVEYIPGTGLTAGAARVATGYDISWPQCGGAMPQSSSIAVVGVDDGHPFSQNPCLRQEAQWASTASQRGQYMVVDSPVGWSSSSVFASADHGPAGNCVSTDFVCQSYNWGYNAAYADVAYADSQGATSPQWWLDVELPTSGSINAGGSNCYQANFWVCDPKANSAVVTGAVAALRQQGKQAGVYSTQSQWQSITGGAPLKLPIWIAGYDYGPATYCDPNNAATYWFALGSPQLVQSMPGTFDPDTACSA
jgi:hypothetical protein